MTLKFRSMTLEQRTEVFAAIRAGDELLREELIVENLGLVKYWANKLRYLKPDHIDIEDVESAGIIGLIKAIDKYDPEKSAFSTYSTFWITAEIRLYLDQTDAGPTGGMHVKRAINKLHRISAEFTQVIGRLPTKQELIDNEEIQEVAESIRYTVPELLEAAINLSETISLDGQIIEDDSSITLLEVIPDEQEPVEEQIEREDLLRHILEPLKREEKLIINHYYGIYNHEKLTHKQIGKILNLSEQAISDKKLVILEKLKEFVKVDPDILKIRAQE